MNEYIKQKCLNFNGKKFGRFHLRFGRKAFCIPVRVRRKNLSP